MKRFAFIFSLSALSLVGLSSASVKLSGNMVGVSTYIWRGVKQYNGPALQSTASLSHRSLSVGIWSSTVDFGQEVLIETDPFAELTLSSGPLSSALGVTIYTYDLFETFNQAAKTETEFYTKLGWGPIKFSGYVVPSQTSTKGQLNHVLYWTETSLGGTAGGINLSGMLCFGTYSSRALTTPVKEATSFAVFTVAKNIGQMLTAFWSCQRELDQDMDNYFLFGLSYAF